MPRGYKHVARKSTKQVVTGFYDSQLKFARSEEAERVDQYAKPGTSAKKRSKDPWAYTFPTSRYRSRLP